VGKPNRATQAKRNRERSKQERQQEKQEKRSLRNDQKKERDLLIADGMDPDLIGMVAGPQPPIEDL
jgi:hypothetical protein